MFYHREEETRDGTRAHSGCVPGANCRYQTRQCLGIDEPLRAARSPCRRKLSVLYGVLSSSTSPAELNMIAPVTMNATSPNRHEHLQVGKRGWRARRYRQYRKYRHHVVSRIIIMYAREFPQSQDAGSCKQSSWRIILQKVLTAARPRSGHVSLVIANCAE